MMGNLHAAALRPRAIVLQRALGLAVAGILTMAGVGASVASAREHHEHGEYERSHRLGDAGLDTADEDEDEGEGGAPTAVTRTPNQLAFRDKLVDREHELLRETFRQRGHRLTPQERMAVGMHWRYVMRLERMREVAEEQKDVATVTRVDALIDRADKKFSARLESGDGGALPGMAWGSHDGGAR